MDSAVLKRTAFLIAVGLQALTACVAVDSSNTEG